MTDFKWRHFQGDAESLSKLTEGRFTASAVMELARQRGVDLPICAAVDAVINHNASIEATLNALLQRPLKMEIA
jgi:glycerol-3-phosphate dehydrogenase (NAD(P)+)